MEVEHNQYAAIIFTRFRGGQLSSIWTHGLANASSISDIIVIEGKVICKLELLFIFCLFNVTSVLLLMSGT